jgi:hypothetical protein
VGGRSDDAGPQMGWHPQIANRLVDNRRCPTAGGFPDSHRESESATTARSDASYSSRAGTPILGCRDTRLQARAVLRGPSFLTLGVSLLLVFVLPSCSASTPEVVGDPSDDNEQHDGPDGAVPPVAARGSEHHPGDSSGRLSHQSLLLMSCTSGSSPANLKLTVSAWSSARQGGASAGS